jgi:hypothetical protein
MTTINRRWTYAPATGTFKLDLRLDELTARKLVHNEALFREVNERIHDVRSPREAGTDYICECVNSECFETITLIDSIYREIRANSSHFVLIPGHELDDIERVIRREPTYLIVEKLVPVPAAIGVDLGS